MKFTGSQIIYDDPWEDELEGYRFIAWMTEKDGKKLSIVPQADNISEENWKKILTLRKFFNQRFEDKYKHSQGKEEILRAFQAKRLFESILCLFCGGSEAMKRSQDISIRKCERTYRYIIKQLHATLTTDSDDKDDITLPYEDIVRNYY